MTKVSISASIEKSTQDKIKRVAKLENRSFSSMLDILCAEAVIIREKKKK